MPLEKALESLTKAISENTVAIINAVGGAKPASKPGRPAKKDKPVEPKETGPTKEDMVALTQLAVEKHKVVIMPQLRSLLSTMNCKKATELDPSQYTEYMEKVGALIKNIEANATDDSLI